MDTNAPTTIHVMQAGDVAAACTVNSVRLAAAIDAMPPEHPDARLVAVKCLIAGAVLRREMDGPYDDFEADILARMILEGDLDLVL